MAFAVDGEKTASVYDASLRRLAAEVRRGTMASMHDSVFFSTVHELPRIATRTRLPRRRR